MNKLIIRLLSAVVALLFLASLYHFFHALGLRFSVLLIVLLSARELVKILFQPQESLKSKMAFYFCILAIYMLSVVFFNWSALIYSTISILFFSINLWFRRDTQELSSLSSLESKSLLGFFYVGLLPIFADRLLSLTHGEIWFFSLLLVIFSGDSMAYIFGKLWGRNKIMPAISPKKTLEGAAGGLLGSVLGACLASMFLPHIAMFNMAVIGLIVGTIGQFGDFFESLLKRVADIKDSGSLMPGHGGVLDRIDGVLFAAPFFYTAASFFETAVTQWPSYGASFFGP